MSHVCGWLQQRGEQHILFFMLFFNYFFFFNSYVEHVIKFVYIYLTYRLLDNHIEFETKNIIVEIIYTWFTSKIGNLKIFPR